MSKSNISRYKVPWDHYTNCELNLQLCTVIYSLTVKLPRDWSWSQTLPCEYDPSKKLWLQDNIIGSGTTLVCNLVEVLVCDLELLVGCNTFHLSQSDI